jgi:hypothetical protein
MAKVQVVCDHERPTPEDIKPDRKTNSQESNSINKTHILPQLKFFHCLHSLGTRCDKQKERMETPDKKSESAADNPSKLFQHLRAPHK